MLIISELQGHTSGNPSKHVPNGHQTRANAAKSFVPKRRSRPTFDHRPAETRANTGEKMGKSRFCRAAERVLTPSAPHLHPSNAHNAPKRSASRATTGESANPRQSAPRDQGEGATTTKGGTMPPPPDHQMHPPGGCIGDPIEGGHIR